MCSKSKKKKLFAITESEDPVKGYEFSTLKTQKPNAKSSVQDNEKL